MTSLARTIPAPVTDWQRMSHCDPAVSRRGDDLLPGTGIAAPRRVRASLLTALGVSMWVSSVGLPASAQVFTMPTRTGSPRETEPGGVGGALLVTSPIGLRDCATEVWRFVINYQGVMGGSATQLQYFIGIDGTSCSMANTRYPVAVGGARCWPIQQMPSLTVTNPTVPFSYTLEVQARYLVDPLNGDCSNPSTTQGPVGVNHLALIGSPPGDNNQVGTFSVNYDTQPPEPPFEIVASPGEGTASVSWRYQGGVSTSEGGVSAPPPDLQGFWILCDPPRSSNNVDAGDAGDAGRADAGRRDEEEEEEDASASGGTCDSTGLELLDPNNEEQFERYRCSNIFGATATTGVATGLSNGRPYRIAVVAQDLAGNRSTVALASACVTPQPVTDFWESYRGAGGAGTPGFCAARPGATGRGAPGVAALMVGAVAVMAAWRRRRR